MKMKTPFFAAFGSLLFGRRAHRKVPVNVEDFGQMQRVFSGCLPAGALAAARAGAGSRRRIFSTENTFWAFLFQVLSPLCGCREIVRNVQAWWGAKGKSKPLGAGTGGYCQARARLPLPLLASLLEKLATTLQGRVLAHERWLGERSVKIIDGTCFTMPDTPQNQERWPQSGEQAPGCGFPLLKLCALFCLHSGAMLRYSLGNQHDHEQKLTRNLLDGVEKDDILLADRGFCSYALIAALRARGADALMRLHQRRKADFRHGKKLGPDDRLITWNRDPKPGKGPWADQHASQPETLTVRMVRYQIEEPGFRTRKVTLATTLLDPEEYPLEVLAELYRARWNIELRLREIKASMGADTLRCKTPAMIEKELCMNAIGYNLIRIVMQKAAHEHDVELGAISFKGSLDTVRHHAPAIQAALPRERVRLYDQLLHLIAKDRLPWRPDRVEPRAKKRRAKNYHLLTKPRHQMRVPSHRNRPRFQKP